MAFLPGENTVMDVAGQLRAGLTTEGSSAASSDAGSVDLLCSRLESLQNRLYCTAERTNVDHLGRPLTGPGPFAKPGSSPTLLDVCAGAV